MRFSGRGPTAIPAELSAPPGAVASSPQRSSDLDPSPAQRLDRPGRLEWRWAIGAGLVVVIAALLRLWTLHHVPGNPFYDAAVRSMGQSWHNLFFGALEPSGTLAIDKPPIDLWLQVASTRILGFGLVGLHLPEALGGIGAAGLLYGTLRRPFGEAAALLSALALAMLPISVLTARSDTMDSVLACLSIAALWLAIHGLYIQRVRWVLLSAAIMGVAFNVKLSEALLAMPALAALWWWAAPASLSARARTLGPTAAAFTVVALSWAAIASLTPASSRPYPVGSATGSIWRLMFVYNGTDRVSGNGVVPFASSAPGATPGPLRLFHTGASRYGARIGIELVAALILGAAALALLLRHRRGALRLPSSPAGRAAVALGVWLATGFIFFSAMRRLQPRYLEAFTPAVAAVLGISMAWLLRQRGAPAMIVLAATAIVLGIYDVLLDPAIGAWTAASLAGAAATVVVVALALRSRSRSGPAGDRWPPAIAVAFVVALLAAPLGNDIAVVGGNQSDSALHDPTSARLSRYLRTHRQGARYEVVSATVFDIVGLIARDGQPVLVLNDLHGAIIDLPRLQSYVSHGAVRYFYAAHGCSSGVHCPVTQRWTFSHSVRVPGHSGLRRFTAGAAPAPPAAASA